MQIDGVIMLISELIVLRDNNYIGSFFCEKNAVQLILPKLVGYCCHISDFNKGTIPAGTKHAVRSLSDSLMFIYITPKNKLFIPGFDVESDIVPYPEFFTLNSPLASLKKIKEEYFLNLVDPQKQEMEDNYQLNA